MASFQEKVAAVWKSEAEGKEKRPYPLMTWDGAAKLVDVFHETVTKLDLSGSFPDRDSAAWDPAFVKAKYYDILGRVATNVTMQTMQKRVENYSEDGYLLPEHAEAVFWSSVHAAIRLDVMMKIPTNAEVNLNILWGTITGTAKEIAEGAKKVAETSMDIGKYILIGAGVIVGGIVLVKVMGKGK